MSFGLGGFGKQDDKKEREREAARRCRKKKKQLYQDLISEVNALKVENAVLQERLSSADDRRSLAMARSKLLEDITVKVRQTPATGPLGDLGDKVRNAVRVSQQEAASIGRYIRDLQQVLQPIQDLEGFLFLIRMRLRKDATGSLGDESLEVLMRELEDYIRLSPEQNARIKEMMDNHAQSLVTASAQLSKIKDLTLDLEHACKIFEGTLFPLLGLNTQVTTAPLEVAQAAKLLVWMDMHRNRLQNFIVSEAAATCALNNLASIILPQAEAAAAAMVYTPPPPTANRTISVGSTCGPASLTHTSSSGPGSMRFSSIPSSRTLSQQSSPSPESTPESLSLSPSVISPPPLLHAPAPAPVSSAVPGLLPPPSATSSSSTTPSLSLSFTTSTPAQFSLLGRNKASTAVGTDVPPGIWPDVDCIHSIGTSSDLVSAASATCNSDSNPLPSSSSSTTPSNLTTSSMSNTSSASAINNSSSVKHALLLLSNPSPPFSVPEASDSGRSPPITHRIDQPFPPFMDGGGPLVSVHGTDNSLSLRGRTISQGGKRRSVAELDELSGWKRRTFSGPQDGGSAEESWKRTEMESMSVGEASAGWPLASLAPPLSSFFPSPPSSASLPFPSSAQAQALQSKINFLFPGVSTSTSAEPDSEGLSERIRNFIQAELQRELGHMSSSRSGATSGSMFPPSGSQMQHFPHQTHQQFSLPPYVRQCAEMPLTGQQPSNLLWYDHGH
eukprot:CAMPEP_0184649690 /NCGR_PEP_ID=MMETSP0308-20130426/7096_1 /TAXON_ID=38269 /ORGANISM="Gloeochaete witrockiana, Strain SAG 46.84" /LENGTH=727 /DNA_ID=CAMNT_0027082607 /DNA_START=128 /DNA_END=2311 /DNA_ORIENTATION=+